MAELLYGIRKSDGKILSISDILNSPDREKLRGAGCDCICPHPNCGTSLFARLGKGVENGGNEPHFSHQPGFRCDIAYANESALHLMAKEIIVEERKFAAPGVKITWEEAGISSEEIPMWVFDEIPVYRPKRGGVFDCTKVELEKRVSFIVPDIVASTEKGQCLIEIFVTHPVSREKKATITNLSYPTLEIDLSDYKDKDITKEELRSILLKPNKRMRWIYYKGQEEALKKAREYYRNHPKVREYHEEEALAKKWKEEQRRKFEEEQAERMKQRELAREAARAKQRERIAKKEQEIRDFDFNQEETHIKDLEGYTMAKCKYCGKTKRAYLMRIDDSGKSNLRVCESCYFLQRIRGKN